MPAGPVTSTNHGRSRLPSPLRGLTGPALGGLLVSVTLMVVAMAVPAIFDWNVHVRSFPPLHAKWDPRWGPGTIASVLVAGVTLVYARRFAAEASWGRLLLGAYALGAAWMVSLATVDGWDGIGVILQSGYEYLRTARTITSWGDVSTMLHEYVARIDYDNPAHWSVHLSGHPPGAVLFFVLLVALGLGGGLAAGSVVIALAATTPVAVLITLRTLGAESSARSAAPFLVVGPAAIWMAVSADAMFAAVAAWGLTCLAVAATRSKSRATALWGLLAGLLLGFCVLMSYGLPVLGVLALGVLVAARSFRPLPWAVAAAAAVVIAFAAAGFSWWEAFPALRERYYRGVSKVRPSSYWLWGNLAALSFSAGPVVGTAAAQALSRVKGTWPRRSHERTGVVLTVAAVITIALVDLSGLSRGEVERIWLPFVPWLLVGTALLPERWRRIGLPLQVVLALVVQHLLFTGW